MRTIDIATMVIAAIFAVASCLAAYYNPLHWLTFAFSVIIFCIALYDYVVELPREESENEEDDETNLDNG